MSSHDIGQACTNTQGTQLLTTGFRDPSIALTFNFGRNLQQSLLQAVTSPSDSDSILSQFDTTFIQALYYRHQIQTYFLALVLGPLAELEAADTEVPNAVLKGPNGPGLTMLEGLPNKPEDDWVTFPAAACGADCGSSVGDDAGDSTLIIVDGGVVIGPAGNVGGESIVVIGSLCKRDMRTLSVCGISPRTTLRIFCCKPSITGALDIA